MNPDRYADDRQYASDMSVVQGMRMNVFSRIFEIRRRYEQIQTSVEHLETFEEQYDRGDLSRDVASSAMTGVKRLMRSLDTLEYVFPELRNEVWFSGFQSDVNHAFWRVEDGRYNGVLQMESDALEAFSGEVKRILDNISDSTHTNPISQLHRYLEHYGEEFNPRKAPNEYLNEVFEARDLFCLGYFSTGLIVLGRAVERAILQLGKARKINSVDGFQESTEWDSARFFERTKALYNIDMPDGSGKIINKRQYYLVQLLIDYRNQVAHDEYRDISKNDAARMMGQALELLVDLEERRSELEEIEDDQIRELDNVSIPL